MRLLPQYLPLGLVLGAMASPANVQDESKDLRGRDDTFNLSGFTFTDSNGTKSNGTNSGAAPKLNATGVSGSPNGTGTSSNTTANATQSAQPAPSNIVQPALLQKAIAAVGGQDALVALKGVQWDAYQYRSKSEMEGRTPGYADTTIATTGTSTISYDLSGNVSEVRRRDDRKYQVSESWYFARPNLAPVDASLVTRGGAKGFGCYVRGNELAYSPPGDRGGYTDAAWTDVLIREATRLSPKLLLMMQSHVDVLKETTVEYQYIKLPALTDGLLNLTVIFDAHTNLPYVVRAVEDNKLFGTSNNDLVLHNYTTVGGLQLPQRMKIHYNEQTVLLDVLTNPPKVNPTFPTSFFDGVPGPEIGTTIRKLPIDLSAPARSDTYGSAEVFETTMNMLWNGGYQGNLANITATNPMPGLPLTNIVFNDAPAFSTLIGEFDKEVMVVDAPPHQSQLIIDWVNRNLQKKISHLLITHHHHDHIYGAADFVKAGAKLVIPEDFKDYYSKIPNVKFDTVTEKKPFVFRGKNLQVRAVWNHLNVHANDWMYFTWTEKCPTKDSLMAVSVADVWNPGAEGYQFDQTLAITYLDIAKKNKIPFKNLHGLPTLAENLYNATGYAYPDFNTWQFVPGGEWC